MCQFSWKIHARTPKLCILAFCTSLLTVFCPQSQQQSGPKVQDVLLGIFHNTLCFPQCQEVFCCQSVILFWVGAGCRLGAQFKWKGQGFPWYRYEENFSLFFSEHYFLFEGRWRTILNTKQRGYLYPEDFNGKELNKIAALATWHSSSVWELFFRSILAWMTLAIRVFLQKNMQVLFIFSVWWSSMLPGVSLWYFFS